MKKTFNMGFKTLCVGAMAFSAVSCYDDSALQEKVKDLDERLTKVEQTLNVEVAALNSKFEGLDAAYKLADADFATALNALTAKLDALDGSLDGYLEKYATDKATLLAAIDELKAADKALAAEDAETLAALAALSVTNVAKDADGNVVLTFADKTTVTLSTKPQDGLVTVIEADGVKYWAVLVGGEPQSLDVPVGVVDIKFEVNADKYLLFSVDGGLTWNETGAYVAADAHEHTLIDMYQGSEWNDELWEEVVDDFYTFVLGDQEYQLPLYKVDNSVVMIKSGKTYFTYGESKTLDVVLSDVTAAYVMSKPDGWKVKLDGKKLTVTAPSEANVQSEVAEASGEVLLHCTTTEGKCKIAKLNVSTTSGFSLTVAKDGTVTIVNPYVVTTTNMWGEELTDFNDAYVGLAPVAAFEADPLAYVTNIDSNWDDKWIYIANWKMNTADMDEDWNPIYVIGDAYVPGVYEVDTIVRTVPQMYADWSYGQEIPAGTPYVVWACPMDENGLPNTEDLVYAYYLPPVSASIEVVEGSVSATDLEVKINVVGANTYYVGLVPAEYTYGFPIDEYMQNQEGPFGYFQMALQYGMPEYAFSQMGTMFGGEFGEVMPETINASTFNYGSPFLPNTKFYMWVFPVVEGLELTDYNYEENLKPYIYEFTTAGIQPGGSLNATFGDAELSYTSITVPVSAEGAMLVYYNFYDVETYNEMSSADVLADLLSNGYVKSESKFEAVNNNLSEGTSRYLAAVVVDENGMYGDVVEGSYTTPTLEYSETFVATLGEPVFTANGKNWDVSVPVTVEGGTAAKYYYYWGNAARTEEQLATLPLKDFYSYYEKTEIPALLFNQYYTSYQFAVVVESTTGELSKPVFVTVNKPSAE